MAVQDRVALADLSAFSKFEILGRDANVFIKSLGANKAPSAEGRIALMHVLAPGGGVLSEFTVTRIGEDRYYLVGPAAAERHDLDLLRARAGSFAEVTFTPKRREHGVLGLMGPEARNVLARLTDADLSDAAFPWMSSREIHVSGCNVLALRVSYIGEPGFELHHAIESQAHLFESLFAAGRDYDIGFYGAYAMNAMRLEKGYRAWGTDLTSERTPLEAGLEAFVRTEGRDFVGRDALLARTSASDRWRMVQLEMAEGGPDPFYGHPVMRGETAVGLVTSGAFGHRIGKRVALAYMTDGAAPDDSDLSVLVLGESINAKVLEKPPYDPNNLRPKRGFR